MPNFNVHWMVAIGALGSAPAPIQRGYKLYRQHALGYRDRLLQILGGVRGDADLEGARADLAVARNKWSSTLLSDRTEGRDEMTCFSAYALGACGPDFWMLPSPSRSGGPIPDMADKHFDLGHYNRTHRQFEVSIENVGGGLDDPQKRAEQAYFLGMATHFAADLSLHQLVNVSAGAYNLLEKKWHNEQALGPPWWKNVWNEVVKTGVSNLFRPVWAQKLPEWQPFIDNLTNQLGIWSTHNKVEHYWDTYVRYRYLGDVPWIFKGRDERSWAGFEPCGLPTAEGLWRELRARNAGAPASLGQLLNEPWLKWAIEKPLMLPWLFCERMLAGEVKPFIHARVVDGTAGAYPNDLVPKEVTKEKDHPQMKPVKGGLPSELSKVALFSTAVNLECKAHSWNFLTYNMCPDLEKLVKPVGRDADPRYPPGYNTFYDLEAVGYFARASVEIAKAFVGRLAAKYATPSSGAAGTEIGPLKGFWNLDTGLGLRVQTVATDTPHDVVTRIELHHVYELLDEPLPYFRQVPWLELHDGDAFGFPAGRAFQFRESQQRYASLGQISEPDQDEYAEVIRLTDEARSRQQRPGMVSPDAFWQTARGGHLYAVETPTETVCASGGETHVSVMDLAHRLTLSFRAAIADLGGAASDGTAHEKLSLFAVSDKKQGLSGALKSSAVDWAHDQYVDRDGVIVDFKEAPEHVARGLQYFSTAILLGFEMDPALGRIVELGTWNNAVTPHEVGRNVSISTGRRLVLHPDVTSPPLPPVGPTKGKSTGRQFDPAKHYKYYEDAYPTEQLYFTIYPLVRTKDGVFDAFAKKKVTQDQLKELTKIEEIGVVKLVLMYALEPYGALQLSDCWVDGVRVPVKHVTS